METTEHAERALLGSILAAPHRAAEVAERIPPDAFTPTPRRLAWMALQALVQGERDVCILSLSDAAQELRGGQATSDELRDLRLELLECSAEVNSSAHLGYYASHLQASQTRAAAGELASETVVALQDAPDVPELVDAVLDSTSSGLEELRARGSTSDFRSASVEVLDDLGAALSTGLIDLDGELTRSGLRPGQLVVLAAASGAGKTTLATTLAEQLDAPVLFVSLEMGHAEIRERLRDPYAARVFVDTDSQTIAEIQNTVARAVREKGVQAVFVDYLQLVEPAPENVNDNRERQVSEIARRLKNLARAHSVIVCAGSQLNEEGRLRESRAIGHHADVVLRLEGTDDRDVVRAVVQKQRNGPKDGSFRLRLRTDPALHFASMAPEAVAIFGFEKPKEYTSAGFAFPNEPGGDGRSYE